VEKVAWTSPSRPSGKRIVEGDLLAPFLAAARKREIKRALFSRLPQCRAAKSGTCTKLVRPIAVQPRSRRKQVFQSTAAETCASLGVRVSGYEHDRAVQLHVPTEVLVHLFAQCQDRVAGALDNEGTESMV